MGERITVSTNREHSGISSFHIEWAAAAHTDTGWELLSQPTTDRDAATAEAATVGGALISREVSTWEFTPDEPPRERAREASPELVNRLIDEETAHIRTAIAGGATIVVTKPHRPGERMIHALGCPALETLLDRNRAWDWRFRERLAEDPNTRPPMPDFYNRANARRLFIGTRECKTCEPGLETSAGETIRSLRASNLGNHHRGLTLASDGGAPLGTIISIETSTSDEHQQRWGAEQVTVITDQGSHELAGTDRINVLRNISHANIAARETALRNRLGID